MLASSPYPMRRIRSFVRRCGRETQAQEEARSLLWPQCGLRVEDGAFQPRRHAPRFLEIGFGMGQSLLALAKANPEQDFIGVETHKPGMGALLLGMQREGVNNIYVYDADVVDVLAQCIADDSLDGVQIFFPDPWPKRRHHARRLIQPLFVQQIMQKLKPNGVLHVATDWDDYAKHIRQVLGVNESSLRSPLRPVTTKFERRALREGRHISEFQLQKI